MGTAEKLCSSLQVTNIEPPLFSQPFLTLSISLEFQQVSVVKRGGENVVVARFLLEHPQRGPGIVILFSF